MSKIKTASNTKSQELKFSLMVLVLMFFCFYLLVISTFTQLKLFTISEWHLKQVEYIPQIPVIMFLCGLLGKKYGTFSVIIYLFTGLFLVPIFALGGGIDYVLNYNFGYLLGFAPAVFFAAKIIDEKISLIRLFLSTLCGISIIHLFGVFYLTIFLLIEHENAQTIFNWIKSLTLNNIFIDFLLGFVMICFGIFIKTILKKIA